VEVENCAVCDVQPKIRKRYFRISYEIFCKRCKIITYAVRRKKAIQAWNTIQRRNNVR